MITRIYVDNFRSLVNFEWKPGRVALLMGANGSGKTSVIDVLALLRHLVTAKVEFKHFFPPASRARWETRPELTIEVDATTPAGSYRYKVQIAHSEVAPDGAVTHETLHRDDVQLMEFVDGELQMFADDGTPGARVAGDVSRLGLGAIAASKQSKLVTAFKDWLRDNVSVFKPDPRRMSDRTDERTDWLSLDLSTFASWLPQEMTKNFGGAVAATAALRHVLDGFESLQVNRTAPRLEASFRQDGGSEYAVSFDELSDGQRQLCALYFLRHLRVLPGRLVIFDEPDNYVALREIQPWLTEVLDLALAKNGPQLWLISHHPEVINQLAPGHGVRFFRRGGPTRIEPFAGAEGLTAAETIARGWDGE